MNIVYRSGTKQDLDAICLLIQHAINEMESHKIEEYSLDGDDNMKKTGTRTLETSRLILRRFTIEDADDMYNNWASDSEVTEFLTWSPHPNVDFTRQLLKDWISKYEDGAYFNWVIELKENGQAIGNISVVELNEKIEAAEIGYCMSKNYWGQGIMPEALKSVADYLFDVVELNRVAACHDANNPKSGRVMDKAGMKLEGTLRATGKNNKGVLYDKVWHSMIKSDRC
ncbi:GNAT family N-acetyltransferase [Butyrivibrio fibrisolvens]|uniref:GNAT family N-acetyltransferase n=1 Tax=Butyrivibrio fibrisolvens TaxID=831 RepID=UPI001FA789A7|nr:GNAT family N-acetyltransferase [Butyrivibrio fibrisolvens]